MKISLQWLSDYLPGVPDAQRCAEALTQGGFPVESIETIENDTVLDVEVTSNRGDCLSHVGMARELGALLDRPMKALVGQATESSTPASAAIQVAIEAADLCPLYTARVIRNVKIAPSPQWMQRRLIAVGLRPINNVVDITNYVLFELGQPLHAFDHDTIQGRRIVVRRAASGEKLVSLDGHERALTADTLVIADAGRPVALAGVMGGRDTEVNEGTTTVLLEAARFDPLTIRNTARRLAMKSDSSYRFERGLDPTLAPRASLRAAQLILELAGGELLAGEARQGSAVAPAGNLALRLPRLKQLLGYEIPAEQALAALKRLELSPRPAGDRIEVTVPSHRLDLTQEADLIEEVARLHGYDKIPTHDQVPIRLTAPDPRQKAIHALRQTLVAAGYFEAVTVGFVSDLLKDDFLPAGALGLPRAEPATRGADAHLRPSLIPGLLEALRRNEAAGVPDARLFEIGSTFWIDPSHQLVERRALAMVGSETLRDVRGAVEVLLEKLDAQRPVRVVPAAHNGLDPQASGDILWGETKIGWIGRIATAVAEKLSLRRRPVVAEIDVAQLLDGLRAVPQLIPLPRFPAVRRDLSLVLAETVRYEQIDALVRRLQLDDLEAVDFVTTYRGKPLDKGQKSLTIALVFRAPLATLTSEQVEQSVARVIEAAQKQLGASLRA